MFSMRLWLIFSWRKLLIILMSDDSRYYDSLHLTKSIINKYFIHNKLRVTFFCPRMMPMQRQMYKVIYMPNAIWNCETQNPQVRLFAPREKHLGQKQRWNLLPTASSKAKVHLCSKLQLAVLQMRGSQSWSKRFTPYSTTFDIKHH